MLARTLRGDIRCEFDLGQDLGVIEVDPSQLQIALINLAANARDAMPKGGTFRVRTFAARIDGQDAVALEASDTGEGMTPEVLARAGEPFFTTKEIGKGTGLGLAQVHGFAQQSGRHGRDPQHPRTGHHGSRAAAADGCRRDRSGDQRRCRRIPEPVSPARVLLVEDNEQVAESPG